MVMPGNIDPHTRPKIRNPDGSISTVRTLSFNSDGNEILVPTVIGDRIVSDDEAIDHYFKTGQSFGAFRTPEAATAFAERLHNSQAEEYGDKPQMSQLDRIAEGIRRAHAAGDVEAVRKLGAAYRQLQGQGGGYEQATANASRMTLKGGPGKKPQAGDNLTSQGLSGLNEGIANLAGLPVDLSNTVLGLGMSGINAVAGTDFKPAPLPVGGSEFFKQVMAPTIGPDPTTAVGRGVRRVGQEVGAMVIPGAGLMAKSAAPVRAALGELASSVGSGTGAAVAQEIAPGNPLAEFAGQMAGGLTPGGVTRMVKGGGAAKAAPTVEELQAAKSAAYKAADDAGITYDPQGYDKMLTDIVASFKKDRFNPKRHSVAATVFEDLVAERGKPMTLTELDQLRQIVRRDVVNPSYKSADLAADGHFGEIILDEIDNYIASNTQGGRLITEARELNTRLRKTELIERALVKAERRAASTGSGGNLNNAIRQNIRAILDDPKKARAFTKDERAAMEKLVRQGKMEDLLRWVGKFSPGGNGLIGMLQVGGTILNPAMAALPIAGMAAKGLADKGTVDAAARLQAQIARGTKAPRPLPKPYSFPLLAAQASGQIAN